MDDIAITGLPLDHPHSGSAVYTRELVSRLPQVAPDLAFHLYNRNATFQAEGVRVRNLRTPVRYVPPELRLGARLDKLLWEVAAMPLAALAFRHSLLHFTYFAAPPLAPCPVVVTIHDVIPLVMTGHHRTRQSDLYSRAMAFTAARASFILTVSEFSRREILRVLPVGERRVCVTYEGVDERFFTPVVHHVREAVRSKYGLPARYLLYVGSAERRKNLSLLVRVVAAAAPLLRESRTRLVLVTHFPPPDALYPNVPALVRDLEIQDIVQVVPNVDEIDMPAVFQGALAFCFPSRYEGFGLPPLEAMAAGVPVLAAACTSVPEITGDAALLLQPDVVAEWVDALTQVMKSESTRSDLIARGRARARQFSWHRTAEQTAEVYRRALDR